jgi:hypothetical protein
MDSLHKVTSRNSYSRIGGCTNLSKCRVLKKSQDLETSELFKRDGECVWPFQHELPEVTLKGTIMGFSLF